MRLLGISGSPSRGSRTSRLIQEVLDATAQQADIETELLEVASSGAILCDGRPPEAYEGETRQVIDKVVAADAYVVGSPMYRGSYTGAFKNLFDLLPNDALTGKVVGLVATGGSDHHFLALEHQLRPLLSFFRAYTVPGTVYAQNVHFTGGEIAEETRRACRLLAEEVVRLTRAISEGQAGPAYPVIVRRPDQQKP
ncbi:NAD(P)H-dependent oxidoreductase [Microvirga makkahensis]|uniref:NAD(P)H-dependent oxidoreductase n=1 Tax=Microvirga makkahensis TaxID=1128670 RepID=A0A7X3MVY8_9HYPH|nr:NAD(P)H-dependent oxidoreductase [Microvirga makkahensis]MXQ14227.1 NAD(P)H-dependent oxidoreductase [Microvirga makkahensis]